MQTPYQFTVGDAQVTIINVGDLRFPIGEFADLSGLNLPADDPLQAVIAQEQFPIQCFHIQLPHASVLVDAGVYDLDDEPMHRIEGYTPPPSLFDQLASLGISRESIDYVVITHWHFDHINGTTMLQDGAYVPTFPEAVYYLGKGDWEHAEEYRTQAGTIEHNTLQMLHAASALELVDGDLEITEGVTIFHAPGESPGHQILRVQSQGETLYCLGDLVHNPVEFLRDDLAVQWADTDAIAASRRALKARLVDENAVLMATHIREVGRLVGARWQVISL